MDSLYIDTCTRSPTHCVLCHTLSSVGEQRDVHLHLKQTEHCHLHTVNDGDWTGGEGDGDGDGDDGTDMQ